MGGEAGKTARRHLVQLRDARIPALGWGPKEMGAALTKRIRAEAGAADSWPIPGG